MVYVVYFRLMFQGMVVVEKSACLSFIKIIKLVRVSLYLERRILYISHLPMENISNFQIGPCVYEE